MKSKMKKVILLVFSIALLSGLTAGKAIAQVSVNAHATAEVIQALSATETSQINFGRFTPQSQGGKIIITPDGVRTAQGSVVLGAGVHNSASFYITGQYEAAFSITLPSGAITLTCSENAKTMQITDWQSSAAGMGGGKLVKGEMTVQVGATLIVGDMTANPVGIYSGIFAISFAYN